MWDSCWVQSTRDATELHGGAKSTSIMVLEDGIMRPTRAGRSASSGRVTLERPACPPDTRVGSVMAASSPAGRSGSQGTTGSSSGENIPV